MKPDPTMKQNHQHEKKKESRQNSEEDHDGKDDDGDDRKPPAREVVVPRRRRPTSPGSHDMAMNVSNDSSTDAGDAESLASSVMTPNASPVTPHELLCSPPTLKVAAYEPPTVTFPAIFPPAASSDPGTLLSHQAYQEQERAIRGRITTLAGAVFFSFAYFLYVVLPTAALAALVTTTVLSGMVVNEMYQYAVTEYTDRAEHRGFGDLLPEWLFQMLTQQTLHEFLSSFHGSRDPNSNPTRHLMLYFLPGLSAEQRNAYIGRLPRRHQRMLQQPGLGELVGDGFMTFLLGQQQFHERRGTRRHGPDPRIEAIDEEDDDDQDTTRRALEQATPAASLQRRLDQGYDDFTASSNVGLQTSANNLAAGRTEEQPYSYARRRLRLGESAITNETVVNSADFATPPRGNAPQNRDEKDDDDDEEEEEEDRAALDEAELRIITEAALATMWTQYEQVARTVMTNAATFAAETSRQVASSLARRGTRIALYAGGIGLVGIVTTALATRGERRGFWNSMVRDLLSPALGTGAQSSVWSLLVLGGGGVATALYTTNRMFLRQTPRRDGTKPDSPKKSPTKKRKTK